jgi:hypothetical protein
MENSKMQFILKGFGPVDGFRVFVFEGVAADRTRTAFTVRTDLNLTRQYGIRQQELPLLCRAVLERDYEDGDNRAFTYTENDMWLYANCAAARAEAAKQKKPARRPVPTEQQPAASGWRMP